MLSLPETMLAKEAKTMVHSVVEITQAVVTGQTGDYSTVSVAIGYL